LFAEPNAQLIADYQRHFFNLTTYNELSLRELSDSKRAEHFESMAEALKTNETLEQFFLPIWLSNDGLRLLLEAVKANSTLQEFGCTNFGSPIFTGVAPDLKDELLAELAKNKALAALRKRLREDAVLFDQIKLLLYAGHSDTISAFDALPKDILYQITKLIMRAKTME
jgi:hypothetical protein